MHMDKVTCMCKCLLDWVPVSLCPLPGAPKGYGTTGGKGPGQQRAGMHHHRSTLQTPKDLPADKQRAQFRVYQLLRPLPPANSLRVQQTWNGVSALVVLPANSSCLFLCLALTSSCFFHCLYWAVLWATLWTRPQLSALSKCLLLVCKFSNLGTETASLAAVLLWVRGWTETPEGSDFWAEFVTLPNHAAVAA